jgi:formylglycine-generating enzyme required for sulfatase activity
MEFCYVPPGPFWMGMDQEGRKEISRRWKVEQEGSYRETKLTHGFWIARHPVTVAQFNLFVENRGYREERWWTEAVQAGLWKDGKIASQFWDPKMDEVGEEWRDRPGDSGPRFLIPNHPIVDVNWYEVMAFCRWLHHRVAWPKGLHLGLPSEAEWEKAARGGEQVLTQGLVSSPARGLIMPDQPACLPNDRARSRFPWGDNFEVTLANCYETKIEAPSATGCFTRGAGPCGAQDLAGNVWEWTRSLWGTHGQKPQFAYPYDPKDDRENAMAPRDCARVLRGGSWGSNADGARCASRGRNDPDGRYWNVGFRVVASPFCSEL